MNTAVMGIVITIVINIVMASFTYGTVVTRLSHVEDKVKGQEITIKEATKLETKLAVIESQLSQINMSLTRLERTLKPKD